MKYIILLLASFSVNAQNYRITYRCEGKIKPNITKHDIGYLIINSKIQSKFFTEAFYKTDSILKSSDNNKSVNVYEEAEKINNLTANTFIKEFILKNSQNGSVSSQVLLGMDKYLLQQKISINWEILNEQENYFNYKCSWALGEYAGRKYKALYTEDIPISDGPFKFRGLPGLILKIYDVDSLFKFEMVQIQKVTMQNDFLPYKFSELQEISFKDFIDIRKDFEDNPLKQFTDAGFTVSTVDQNIINAKKKAIKPNHIEIKHE